ncbi:hypothetical protein [Terracidiphilus gabretensis]|uniref:hypothetical protein n=1 Tax=Terracidiphilus gabretensis TaxID=1577687 RepID=UPI00071BC195|nr:hypothetical protein [Terracidiphilus gabretensis]
MDRGYFILSCLPGLIVGMAVFFPLGAKRRAWIPPLAWWLCLILGAVICIYGLSHSTAPSFARRITAVGKAYDCVEIRQGRDSHFGFRFVPEGGEPIQIETPIILPGWANPAVFNGRTFRIMYLGDTERALKNEAIDIEILSGRDAGFHDSLDARPAGKWLAIPIGAALGALGFLGLRYMKKDADSAALDDEPSA